jgi:two-component system, NarL family, nitrate/nitrite response regulator NarL
MTDVADTPLRILIIDDHAMVRAGLRMLIEQEQFLRIVGEAGDLPAAVSMAEREQPDIILLDLDMAGQNGLDILPELLASAPQTRVLVLTGVRDREAHRDAMRLGASGVLVKDQAGEVLLKAIQKVQAGEMWLDHVTMSHLLAEMRAKNLPQEVGPEEAKIGTLSDREREVLTLVSQGLKNREIAVRLFISEHTVRHHIGAIFAKLDVSDRLELVLYAYRHRLATPPAYHDPSKPE